MPAVLRNAWSVVRGDVLKPIPDWVGCVVMDPGQPDFRQLLLLQLARHFDLLGQHFEGIAIDRLDYSEFYNTAEDDGLTWVPQPGTGARKYGPARALRISHRAAFEELGSMLHTTVSGQPRLLWLNCNSLCRVDLFAAADGTLGEGSALNMVAWVGLGGPSVLWTYELADSTAAQLDAYFQQHLLMDTFPMAPMPKNDHSQLPGNATVEAAYMAYGQLFAALAGCRWLLVPQPLDVVARQGASLETNVFTRPAQGDVLAVLALASQPTAEVRVRLAANDVLGPGATGEAGPPRAQSLVPGGDAQWADLPVDAQGFASVTLARGAALVRFFS